MIDQKGDVTIQDGATVADGCRLLAERGRIVLGPRCHLSYGVIVEARGGEIVLGERVDVEPYSVLYGLGGLHIGAGTLVGCHCVLVPGNHGFADPAAPIRSQRAHAKGIRIGAGAWLGARVVVLDGATIGEGAVIGAGSVVTKDVPPMGVAWGSPARTYYRRGESR